MVLAIDEIDTADVMRVASNEAMEVMQKWNREHLPVHNAILQRLDKLERTVKKLEVNVDVLSRRLRSM